jgi:hypothetical protein
LPGQLADNLRSKGSRGLRHFGFGTICTCVEIALVMDQMADLAATFSMLSRMSREVEATRQVSDIQIV